jgi:uncharacterized membrane protein
MSTDPADSLAIDRTASASAIGILSEGVSTARRTPVIFGVYLLVAGIGVIIQLLSGILSLIAAGIAVVMVYTTLGGCPANQVSFGVRLIIVLIGGLITGILLIIGFILFIIPGIYLAIRLRLVIPAIMVEDCGPIEALRRSFSLTKGHTWTVFGVALVFFVSTIVLIVAISFAIGGDLSGPIDLAMFQRAVRFGGAITTVVITPISVASNAVMYGLYSRESHR